MPSLQQHLFDREAFSGVESFEVDLFVESTGGVANTYSIKNSYIQLCNRVVHKVIYIEID